MTPKEKANELFHKFKREINWIEIDYNVDLYRDAKQCALIAVEELIRETKLHDKTIFEHGRTAFWNEVKKEIENFKW